MFLRISFLEPKIQESNEQKWVQDWVFAFGGGMGRGIFTVVT